MESNPISIADAQKGSTQLTIPDHPDVVSAFANAQSFELAQRIGGMFSRSMLVPKTFQGPDGLPDCVIAYNMANRIGCDPLMVMQNLYVVHGKPAWSGQFVIAAINQSGLFAEPLHFEFVGTEGQDDWGCYALGITKAGREIKGPKVTIGMAKAEGWHGKNPKWRNMPELMLRYRAGAFFGKTECPELLMGFKTADEVRDIIDVNPDTGEILNKQPLTPASAGGATIEPVDDDPDGVVPWGAGTEEQEAEAKRVSEEVERLGYYTKTIEGEGKFMFSPAGERFDPDQHATSSTTQGPIMNKDGSFRARRGTATDEAKAAAKKEQEPIDNASIPGEQNQGENPPVSNYGLD